MFNIYFDTISSKIYFKIKDIIAIKNTEVNHRSKLKKLLVITTKIVKNEARLEIDNIFGNKNLLRNIKNYSDRIISEKIQKNSSRTI